MAAPTVVEKLIQQTENAVATVTTAVGTQSTDLLVCFHFIDFYAASSMTAPTGTSLGSWTLAATGDAGTNDVHVKVWTKQAQAAAQTIICNQVSDACNWNITYVLRGAFAFTADAANGSQSASNSTSHIAPSISPLSVDDLLLCAAIGGGAGSYTPPSGMTEDFDSACGANSTSSVAELVLTAAGATGTKTFTYTASVHNATASIAIAGSAPPAGSIPWTAPQKGFTRDPGEVQWLQRDRRDANTVATAANPPVSPLDTAWQASAAYWHLYNDSALWSRRAYFTQRMYVSDPSLLAADDPLTLAAGVGGDLWRRYNTPDYGDRRQVPQQRAYISNPALLGTAELEDVLLAGSDRRSTFQAAVLVDRREMPQQRPYISDPSLLTAALLEDVLLGSAMNDVRMLPATNVDRRQVPQQRVYVSDPLLLGTALLEDALLGFADQDKRINIPVTHAARWWLPQQPARDTYTITDGLLENELLGGAETGKRVNVAATHTTRWWPPQQPLRDTYTVSTAELENELLGGAETSKRANLPATHVPRWWMPQQPPHITYLITAGLLENELLGNADTARHQYAAAYMDRRQVPQQRPYLSDPSFYPTVAPADPLTLAFGAGGHYWLIYNTAAVTVDRRLVPQQRPYRSDPGLLNTALLEDVLLGGGDTARHTAWFTDRREMPQQRIYTADVPQALDVPLLAGQDRHYSWYPDRRTTIMPRPIYNPDIVLPQLDVPYLTRPLQPRYSPAPFTPQQRTFAALGVDADPSILQGNLWRMFTPATHADRRRTAAQPPRQTADIDAGPGSPPLTLAFGAGGSMWHRYNRWWRDPQWIWWQLPQIINMAAGTIPTPGIIVIADGTQNVLTAAGISAILAAAGTSNTLTAGGTP